MATAKKSAMRQTTIREYYKSSPRGAVPKTPRSHRWRSPAPSPTPDPNRRAPVTPSSSTKRCPYCKTGKYLATPPTTKGRGKSKARTPRCTDCRQFLFCGVDSERQGLWGPCPRCKRGHQERFMCSPRNMNNPYRLYFKCSRADDGCKYFQWKDGK
ncbi:hypothetical protein LQW54_004518 [Pestalotiopsis sp. IQ-011]